MFIHAMLRRARQVPWIVMAALLLAPGALAVTKTVCAEGCDYINVSGAMAYFVANPTGADTISVTGPVNEEAHIATWAPGVALIGTGNPTITESALGNIRFATIADPTLPITVKGITFTGFGVKSNTAGSGNYGGCFLIRSSTSGHAGVTFDGCTFDGCWAGGTVAGDTGRGSAIYLAGGSSALTLTDCVYTDCVCTYEGAEACGGAVYVNTSTGTIAVDGCTFGTAGHGNSVVGSGSEGRCIAGGLRIEHAPYTLENSTFTANTAEYVGGFYFWTVTNQASAISGCTFTNNEAVEHGGAMWIEHGDFEIDGCAFVSNEAGGFGGALCTDAEGTFTGCTFTDNVADSAGGAVYLAGGIPPVVPSYDAAFTGCIFQGNSAELGGAIAYPGRAGAGSNLLLTLTDCIMVDNTASEEGTDVYWYESTGDGQTTGITAIRTIFAHGDGDYGIGTDAADWDQFDPQFSCCDTLDYAPEFAQFGQPTCSNCISASPAWCDWSDDDTANDVFTLRGSSPCYALTTCGYMGPYTWCTTCGDSCWAVVRASATLPWGN